MAVQQILAYQARFERTARRPPHADIQGEIAIMELTKSLHAEYKLTVILVSHDLNIVANYVKTLSIIDKNTLKFGPVDSMLSEETLAKVYGIKVKIANISGHKAIISELNE